MRCDNLPETVAVGAVRVGTASTSLSAVIVTVGKALQSKFEVAGGGRPPPGVAGGLGLKGQLPVSPQLSAPHGVGFEAEVLVEIVVVPPVTLQPVVVTVFVLRQVDVVTILPWVEIIVGLQVIVTLNAVFVCVHELSELSELVEALLSSEFDELLSSSTLSSSSVFESISDIISSTPSTTPPVILLVMSSSWPVIQLKALTTSLIIGSLNLFFPPPHGLDDGLTPRLGMTPAKSS